jgi:hypothetical protein
MTTGFTAESGNRTPRETFLAFRRCSNKRGPDFLH